MPPKKDKKKMKLKQSKPMKKKMRLSVQEPLAQFATGFNRPIPGGLIGTGGAGGTAPASFALGGYASRQPPPATPIQTPDQFQIQRQIASQAQAIESIVEEQKAVRRGRRPDSDIAEAEGITIEEVRARRAQQRMPTQMPMESTPMKQQMASPQPSVTMAEAMAVAGGDMKEPPKSIGKVRKMVMKINKSAGVAPPEATAPPVIGTGATFPGGGAVREQGLNMATPGRLRGLPPDASQSLVGIQGIGESDVFMAGGGGTLRPQGDSGEGGM
jgi:hypothetical protein